MIRKIAAILTFVCVLAIQAQNTFTESGTNYGAEKGSSHYSSAVPLSSKGTNSSMFGISLVPGVQYPAEDCDIQGLRFNVLWGRHNNVSIFDIGLLCNQAEGDMDGIQLAGICNMVGCGMEGLQISALYNNACGYVRGLQLACLNENGEKSFTQACQIGLVNVAPSFYGLQLGAVNYSDDCDGVQLGVVNMADNMRGLQIGVCNIIRNSTCPVMILINFSY